MSKYFRDNEENSHSMYRVSHSIVASSEIGMEILGSNGIGGEAQRLDVYDEKSGRWFCSLGCGFRDRREAEQDLNDDKEILDRYYAERQSGVIIRESFAVASTYNYDRDVFSCNYEIAEYDMAGKRSARFNVEDVRLKELKEIEKAIKAWHITGEMIWNGLYIELGSWEPIIRASKDNDNSVKFELPF